MFQFDPRDKDQFAYFKLSDNPAQFYVSDNHVEGIAIMDTSDGESYDCEPIQPIPSLIKVLSFKFLLS